MSAAAPTLRSLTIADDAAPWEGLGFGVCDGVFEVGSISIVLAGAGSGEGIASWGLSGVTADTVDGLPTSGIEPSLGAPAANPNGATRVDHVVVMSPSLDRTASALDDIGVELRRERAAGTPDAPMRQGFFRLGEVILEVVAPASEEAAQTDEPARFWGMVFVVDDLDALGARLGDALGAPRDAVQPGRRIATVKPSAGVSVPVAFMTPHRRG